MRRIILWYNANRKSIWKMIGVIVAAILVLQLVRFIWKQNQINQQQVQTQNIDKTNEIIDKFNSLTLEENKSPITGQEITTGQTKALEVLDQFMTYCNNKQINEAYNLLSADCKNEMYPTVQHFKNSYYNTAFAGKKKNINIENWTGNIYKIKYMEDALSTGVYTTQNTIQDYITLTHDNEKQIKLNINNYIGKQEVNKQLEAYGIKIKVVEKDTYMGYETYTFEITNNSDNPILMNDINNIDCMYLEDANGIKYNAYMHELSEAELKLALKETKTLKVKYYNQYSSMKKINKIVFSKVILKHNAYVNYRNPGYYKDYGVIQINL